MPFATTWMELEIIILSEVNQEDKYHMSQYMWNLQYAINQFIYRKETDPQIQKTNLQLPEGKEGGAGIS